MQNALFLRNKVSRQIKMNGSSFSFNKVRKDEFNQTEVSEESVEVKGLFHQTASFIKEEAATGSRIKKKPSPMILMLSEDASKLEEDFQVTISGKIYRVVDKLDVNNFGVAFDVSLEVVV